MLSRRTARCAASSGGPPLRGLSPPDPQSRQGQGTDGLKGHRNVGGFRASIYSAIPHESRVALAELLKEFAKKKGALPRRDWRLATGGTRPPFAKQKRAGPWAGSPFCPQTADHFSLNVKVL